LDWSLIITNVIGADTTDDDTVLLGVCEEIYVIEEEEERRDSEGEEEWCEGTGDTGEPICSDWCKKSINN
jgi:hypothetical protein